MATRRTTKGAKSSAKANKEKKVRFATGSATFSGVPKLDYEGEVYNFITFKVKNDPKDKYYQSVPVRVPVDLIDSDVFDGKINVTVHCDITTYFDRDEEHLDINFTAVEVEAETEIEPF